MTTYVLNHVGYDDPGHIATALNELGMPWAMRYREHFDANKVELPPDSDLLVLLGSLWDPTDTSAPGVRAELSLVEKAKEAHVPILGICYGAEILAISSGAKVRPLDEPSIGFRDVCFTGIDWPASRQFFWNHLGFDVPTGATELAVGPESSWAFREGNVLAVQFHPDATPGLLKRWTLEGSEELNHLGVRAADIVSDAKRSSADVQSFSVRALREVLNS